MSTNLENLQRQYEKLQTELRVLTTALQQAKVEAVREFGEWLRNEINWDVRHYCEKHIEQLNKGKGDE